jgi:hypothetical protein
LHFRHFPKKKIGAIWMQRRTKWPPRANIHILLGF